LDQANINHTQLIYRQNHSKHHDFIATAKTMRINIDIDDVLMNAAMKAGRYATKKETVEEALRLLVRKQAYEGIRALRGTVAWVGDLSQMRQDRVDYREPIFVKKALVKRLKKAAQ
jgi:Arc/MetJ family transcription regulator